MQITVQDITSAIPAEEIKAEFGVKDRTIRLARENGYFPASWFLGMRRLCVKHGVPCPETLFNFKSPVTTSDTKRLETSPTFQGERS